MTTVLPRTNIKIIEETCINNNILTIYTYKLGRVSHVDVEFNGRMNFSGCLQHWERKHFWSKLELVENDTLKEATRHYKILRGCLKQVKWEGL